MDEYIERECAIKAVKHAWAKGLEPSQYLEIIPTADVATVRHGRWMNANSRPKTYWRRCTACGGLAYFCGIGCSYKYCPNCGAKMDGDMDE